jgi:hypothetical protein
VTRLLDKWMESWSSHTAGVLVGLGPDEVRGLNQGARSLLERHGQLEGPSLRAHGRQYRSGDCVVATGGPGSNRRRGAMGRVVEVDLRRARVSVNWDEGSPPEPLAKPDLVRVAPAYAASPNLAARLPGPVLLLGDPVHVPLLRDRVIYRTRAGAGVEPPVRDRSLSPGLGL